MSSMHTISNQIYKFRFQSVKPYTLECLSTYTDPVGHTYVFVEKDMRDYLTKRPYSHGKIIGTQYVGANFKDMPKTQVEKAALQDIHRIPNAKFLSSNWERLSKYECYKVIYGQLQADGIKTKTATWSIFHKSDHLIFQVIGLESADQTDPNSYDQVVDEFYPVFQALELD
jgi:hypothetical protein